MLSDKRNLITAKATDSIFCCSILLQPERGFGILQCISTWTYFVFHSSLLIESGSMWCLPLYNRYIHSGYFDYRDTFWTVLNLYCCSCNGLKIADNKNLSVPALWLLATFNPLWLTSQGATKITDVINWLASKEWLCFKLIK